MNEYESYIIKIEERKDMLESQLVKIEDDLNKIISERDDLITAREVINEVFINCGVRAKNVIQRIVTSALRLIYGDEYSFELVQQIKYNQTEFRPALYVNKSERKLRHGGITDILSFGFRLAVWALKKKKQGTFWFDEPFRFVQKDKEPVIGQMLQELSSLLGIQVILSTHSESLATIGDISYRVNQDENKISFVERI